MFVFIKKWKFYDKIYEMILWKLVWVIDLGGGGVYGGRG